MANPEQISQTDLLAPPYKGWSPIPGKIPPVPDVYTKQRCPLLPVNCGICEERNVVPAQQPVVPVPVYQQIHKRDRIIEVPEIIVHNKIIPKISKQDVEHEVPELHIKYNEHKMTIPMIEYKEKVIDIPVPVGYKYKMQSQWQEREVPKIVPVYVGKPEDIYIEIPQIEIVERIVEKETPVYVGEKIVKKEVVEEEPVDVVEYKYVEVEEEVPVYRYRPVFDVEVDIPPPLIVPVPVQANETVLDPERMTIEEWKRLQLNNMKGCCSSGSWCQTQNEQDASCCSGCFRSCCPKHSSVAAGLYNISQ